MAMSKDWEWPTSVSGFYGTDTWHSNTNIDREPDSISTLYNELVHVMKDPKNKHCQPFIIESDLKRIWNDMRKITAILGDQWSKPELEIIHGCMQKTLSLLVYIGARDCLSNFRCLFTRDGPLFLDADLPLKDKALLAFMPIEMQDKFIEQQFLFIPYIIYEMEGPKTQYVDSRLRLPFEKITKNIGVGGYGKVDQVKIPQGYLRTLRSGGGELVSISWLVYPSKLTLSAHFGRLQTHQDSRGVYKGSAERRASQRKLNHP